MTTGTKETATMTKTTAFLDDGNPYDDPEPWARFYADAARKLRQERPEEESLAAEWEQASRRYMTVARCRRRSNT